MPYKPEYTKLNTVDGALSALSDSGNKDADQGGRPPLPPKENKVQQTLPQRTLPHSEDTGVSEFSLPTSPTSPQTSPFPLKKLTALDVQLNYMSKMLIELEQSGFYYGNMSMSEVKEVLQKQAVGTFLVRNSSHPEYFFTLAIQTAKGTCSVRLKCRRNMFSLDSATAQTCNVNAPFFGTVLQLLEYYVEWSKSSMRAVKDKNMPISQWVLADTVGRMVPVALTKPFRRGIPSLQHACRQVINHGGQNSTSILSSEQQENLPRLIRYFLEQYPSKL